MTPVSPEVASLRTELAEARRDLEKAYAELTAALEERNRLAHEETKWRALVRSLEHKLRLAGIEP